LVTEARLEDSGSGLAPVTEGWFVVNVRDAEWWSSETRGAAGDGPCAILMVGAHTGPDGRYPVSELAARYGASVEKETSDPEQVYASAERFRRERPPYWARLPWA